jgi:hypothetical protein
MAFGGYAVQRRAAMRHRVFITIGFGLLLGLLLRVLAAPLGPLVAAGPLAGCLLYVVADVLRPAPPNGSRITADLVTFFGGLGLAIVAIGTLAILHPEWRPWLGAVGLIIFPLYTAVRVVLERRGAR